MSSHWKICFALVVFFCGMGKGSAETVQRSVAIEIGDQRFGFYETDGVGGPPYTITAVYFGHFIFMTGTRLETAILIVFVTIGIFITVIWQSIVFFRNFRSSGKE